MSGLTPAILLFILALAWLSARLVGIHVEEPNPVQVKILAVNDLHGGIDTGRTVGDRAVGGAAYLASHLKARAAGHPNVRIVGAGDMVGASPPVSSLLLEEPTIRAMNAMGFLVNAPGNHEFDRGVAEFFRLRDGGCHPTTGCFEGSRFKQISANIVVEATGETLLPPYHVEEIDGVPVAFIGATHSDVANIVIAGAVQGLAFPEPAASINHYVQELKAAGIRAIVVLIHEGGDPVRSVGLAGPIARTVELLDPEVDLVVSAHSHLGYATRHAGKLVTQGYSYSTALVDVDLTVDRESRDVIHSWADVIRTYNDSVAPDPVVQAIVDQAEALVAPQVNRPVGQAARRITADQNRAGESALGNLIADGQRWRMGTQIAATNTGGIRATLEAGPVLWGELYAIQPFGNDMVVMSLTGEQLFTLFNQQWTIQTDGAERYRPLQFSGLRVAWDGRQPFGDRIVSLTLEDGAAIDRAASYRLAVNSFLAGGGSGYAVLTEGTDRFTGPPDLEAFVEYVEQLPQPFDARIEGRITRVD